MAQAFDLSNFHVLRRIIMPNSAPNPFAATRIGVALTLKIVPISEIVAATNGIGYKVVQAYKSPVFKESWG